MRRILLVDDEINVLHAMQRALRQHLRVEEVDVEVFTCPVAALTRCNEISFDIVISDFRMPQMSGVQFLCALKITDPFAVRMMLSASTEFDTVKTAVNEAEVFRYLEKPWRFSELQDCILLGLAHRDAMREENRLAELQRVRAEPLVDGRCAPSSGITPL